MSDKSRESFCCLLASLQQQQHQTLEAQQSLLVPIKTSARSLPSPVIVLELKFTTMAKAFAIVLVPDNRLMKITSTFPLRAREENQ